jgi:LPXTG-motif cell wall-anchored protein
VTVVNGGGTVAVPSTQVFSPPQEIILRSSTPTTQRFTPPATRIVRQTVVVRPSSPTVVSAPQTFTPPRTSNLPFTGSNVALGLIAGIALLCGGGFLLVRRRDELGEALEHQAAALDRLLDR